MTILVDPRRGSADVVPFLRRYAIPRSLVDDSAQLPGSDALFTGEMNKQIVTIGIEYKHVPDALGCITDGRFADTQLTEMINMKLDEIWFLLIDDFKPDPRSGVIMRRVVRKRGRRSFEEWVPALYGRSKMEKYSTLMKWLFSLQHQLWRAGINFNVGRVASNDEAAQWTFAMYEFWNDKRFDQHKSARTFDRSRENKHRGVMFLPKKIKRCAGAIESYDGMGYESAVAIATKFNSSLYDVVNASSDAISKVSVGKTRVGVKKANRFYDQVRGKE